MHCTIFHLAHLISMESFAHASTIRRSLSFFMSSTFKGSCLVQVNLRASWARRSHTVPNVYVSRVLRRSVVRAHAQWRFNKNWADRLQSRSSMAILINKDPQISCIVALTPGSRKCHSSGVAFGHLERKVSLLPPAAVDIDGSTRR